ncbi:MAG: DRTGG domain-containing protein [Bacteroidales bacterium]|nr:DRTGG domain-containing protein [Bacteroidales bacterium]MDD4670217.1 DRTGG domain-containing protein [Bacteroidales bacterium]
MVLKEIVSMTDGKVICGESHLNDSIEYAFASDLMSDVLTLRITNFLLITGLANIQSVRTAEMSDLKYILFARDKKITEEMIELAEENDMMIISTPYSVFKTSGILYGAGLKPVY